METAGCPLRARKTLLAALALSCAALLRCLGPQWSVRDARRVPIAARSGSIGVMRALLIGAGAAAIVASLWLRRKTPVEPPVVPSTMRAVVVRDGKCIVQADWPTPSPAAGEVLIRVVSTAINRLDVLQRLGKAPVPKGVTEVVGLECAGIVVGLGEGVRSFAIGDEVLALVSGGGYAEYVAVPSATVMAKPTRLAWATAGSVPEAWLTAYKLVHVVGKASATERGSPAPPRCAVH